MKNSENKTSGKANKKISKNVLRLLKQERKIMVLMTKVVAVHSVIAALKMPQGKLKRLSRAREIVKACTGNTYVAIPLSVINTINNHITDYKNAKSRSNPDAYRVVRNDLRMLMSKFQTAADADIYGCKGIILSGKFKVSEVGIPQKRKFEAKNGKEQGVVILRAQGGGQNTCHDWQYSPDGVNFVRLPPTVAGKTTVKKLPRGSKAYFTHELVTAKGGTGISQIIMIIVN